MSTGNLTGNQVTRTFADNPAAHAAAEAALDQLGREHFEPPLIYYAGWYRGWRYQLRSKELGIVIDDPLRVPYGSGRNEYRATYRYVSAVGETPQGALEALIGKIGMEMSALRAGRDWLENWLMTHENLSVAGKPT